jgi:hypothetical protein
LQALETKLEAWQSAHAAIDADGWQDFWALKAAVADQRLRHEREICDVEHKVELLPRATVSGNGRNETSLRFKRSFGSPPPVLRVWRGKAATSSCQLVISKGAKEQLAAEAARPKRRMEVMEQDNRRLSEATKAVKRCVREVWDCSPKVKKDVTNLRLDLEKLKEE